MKLDEMGLFGRQVKVSSDAPEHASKIGRVINMTTERVYIDFENGVRDWVSNKYIVGTRRVQEHQDGDVFPITEMAAKKQCEHCGKTMAANHYWYKGGWKCKKSSGDSDSHSTDTATTEPKKLKTAAELGLAKDDGKKREVSQSIKDANDAAAHARQLQLISKLEKQIGKSS